jgi:hypothetical protein
MELSQHFIDVCLSVDARSRGARISAVRRCGNWVGSVYQSGAMDRDVDEAYAGVICDIMVSSEASLKRWTACFGDPGSCA